MIRIEREALDALGFDLAQAVSEYQAALEAHRFTVDVPRPTSHPWVEMIVAKGGVFEVIEQEPKPEPEPQPELPKPSKSALVNMERDRRTAAGVPFMGHVFDFDQMGKDNITGAATLAKFALLKGAKVGDYRWANPNVDFSWIVQSNEKVLMDAHQVSALGDVAAGWATAHIFAARAIKDMDPIPDDYDNDKYWPS